MRPARPADGHEVEGLARAQLALDGAGSSAETVTRPPPASAPAPSATASATASDARRFVIALCLATALPWLILPFVAMSEAESAFNVRRLLFVAGPPHVLATFALYFDPAMRGFFTTHKARFAYLPLVALIVGPLLFVASPVWLGSLVLVGASGWTAFHFSRQNIGVLAFLHGARGVAPLTAQQRRILDVVGIAAVIGVAGYAPELVVGGLGAISGPCRAIALALTVGALIAGAPTIWRLRSDVVTCLFFVESILFFAPIFVFSSHAAVPYAAAHGFQYLVFIAWVTKHKGQLTGTRVKGLIAAAVLIPVVGGMTFRVVRDTGTDAAVGFIVALSAIHFVMDASIWRMREPVQRAYVKERFAFLSR